MQAHDEEWNRLLIQAKSGDQQALHNLFVKLTVTLPVILQSRLRGWPTADLQDILQETLITFARKLGEIRDNPQLYAAGILRNKIGDALRVNRGHIRVPLDAWPESASPTLRNEVEQAMRQEGLFADALSELERKELLERLRQALKKLSLFCQTFFLGILEQREMEEVRKTLEASTPELKPGAFRKRIFDCRMKLKELLQE